MSNRLWVSLMVAMTIASASARADSVIYIDQTGDDFTLTATQIGDGNSMGTAQADLQFYGDGNTVTLYQSGDNNTIAAVVAGDNNTVDLKQVGAGNSTTLTCSTPGACGGNQLTLWFTGDDNVGTVTVTNNNNALMAEVTGDNNTATITMGAPGGIINLTAVGSGNAFTLSQSGSPATGHSIAIDHTGDTGTFSVTQTGSVTKVVSLTTVGLNVSVTVSQSD